MTDVVAAIARCETPILHETLLAQWNEIPPGVIAPPGLIISSSNTLCTFCEQLTAVFLQGGGSDAERRALHVGLAALDAVLSHADENTRNTALDHLSRLVGTYDILAADAKVGCLMPRTAIELVTEEPGMVAPLKSPFNILARCAGAARLTVSDILELSRGDIAVAIATAAAVATDVAAPRDLRSRIWQMLHHLTTPQLSAELAAPSQADQSIDPNATPIVELVARQVAHAHRITLCFLQFDVLEAAVSCAEDNALRGPAISGFLRALHNLVAAPHHAMPGRLIGRRLAVLWPRFGMRFLAPHLRKLLSVAVGSGDPAVVAQRSLRHDLRTLGWLFYHAPELRSMAGPLTGELAVRALKQNLATETLAVSVAVAANAGYMTASSPLVMALDGADQEQRAAVCAQLPKEADKLWMVEESWVSIEELGFWPREITAEPTEAEAEPDPGMLALRGYTTKTVERDGHTFTFDFPDAPYDPFDPYSEWGEGEYEGEEEDEEDEAEDWWGEAELMGDGPLGYCDYGVPDASLLDGQGVMNAPAILICTAPERFRCAIDGRLCKDPVWTPHGILYDRQTITTWLSRGAAANGNVCPVIGQPLTVEELTEDASLRDEIRGWLTGKALMDG